MNEPPVSAAPAVRELTPADGDTLVEFFGALSDEDRTFIREDLGEEAVRGLPALGGLRWVSVDGDTVTGYVAVYRLPGWSDHVGELRLVTHPGYRGQGLGRALAQHALAAALRAGLRKVVVELAADQEYAMAMFVGLGFTGEALLTDHIRGRDGRLRDLVVLAHAVDEGWSALHSVGLDEALLET